MKRGISLLPAVGERRMKTSTTSTASEQANTPFIMIIRVCCVRGLARGAKGYISLDAAKQAQSEPVCLSASLGCCSSPSISVPVAVKVVQERRRVCCGAPDSHHRRARRHRCHLRERVYVFLSLGFAPPRCVVRETAEPARSWRR